jgi:hypothetical protein
MDTEFIIVREFTKHSDIEPEFLALLEENGLIRMREQDNERYLDAEDLSAVESYARMYYDLSINIEGIDAIRHLLDRIGVLQGEMRELRNRLRFLE